MIIEHDGYKRNSNGEISKRTIVKIKCDRCGRQWESKYEYRKKKRLNSDLCRNCRNKLAWSKSLHKKESRKKIDLVCENCNKIYKKNPSSVIGNKHNFCSHKCRADKAIKEKYGHLLKTFEENPNEVSYLIGLILGDGYLRKRYWRTTGITIAFDNSLKWAELQDLAKAILSKLQINYNEGKVRKNCKILTFILPDHILEKYDILYSGNKFDNQPSPALVIKKNVNYAAGLLNSDGQFVYFPNGNWSSSYRFCNTVRSIVDSFSQCLKYNNIVHSLSSYDGRVDRRTGNKNKAQFIIYIGKDNVRKLHDICNFKLKGDILLDLKKH